MLDTAAGTISLPALFWTISVSQFLVFEAGLLTKEVEGAGLCLGLLPSITRLGRFAVGDLHWSEEMREAALTGVNGSMFETEETGVRGQVNFFKGEPSLRGEAVLLVGDW